MPLSEENILLGLIQQQRLKVISASQQQLRLSTEIQRLAQLKSRSEGFLNAYDQLFRYISIWLLIRGYDLTNNQPHQVLKAVCILNCSNWEIDKIIYQRHQLKKKLSKPSQSGYVFRIAILFAVFPKEPTSLCLHESSTT